ncbi:MULTISPECIES: hypothetical protein, partial [unclassified Rathayibacter]|uniref:hypothetical protein n=1 Tax=unclassified Rathayibacter TaxID=2609250 RepID=UPI001C84DCE1
RDPSIVQPQRASHKILSPPCAGAEGAPSARYAHCAGYSISMGRARRGLSDRQGDRPSAGLSDLQEVSRLMLVE